MEETYDVLLDAICSGEFPPGTRLNQDELAARLNVSRQPVNSAISILKANRFVEDTGRRGVVVSAADPAQFRAIYEFRTAVEPFAVRLAAGRLPVEAGAEATDAIGRGRKALAAGDMRSLILADVAFHEMIYRWSGNPVIKSSMRLNWHHTRRFMAEVLRDQAAARLTWDDHETIATRLLAGDPAAASSAMAAHIGRAYEKMTASLDPTGARLA